MAVDADNGVLCLGGAAFHHRLLVRAEEVAAAGELPVRDRDNAGLTCRLRMARSFETRSWLSAKT